MHFNLQFVELSSLLTHDALLFLQDIGNGVIATINFIQSLVNSICTSVEAITASIARTFYCVCSLVRLMHSSLIDLFGNLIDQIINILNLLKSCFILLGSTIIFGISFLPNLACLLITSFFQLIISCFCKISVFIQESWEALKDSVAVLYKSFVIFFHDIPIHSVIGVCIGVVLLVGFKLFLPYIIDKLWSLPVSSSVLSIRRRFLSWYTSMWRESHRSSVPENNMDEQLLNDASDHNGNDNNHNVSDQNLIRNQPSSFPWTSYASTSTETGSTTSSASSSSNTDSHPPEESDYVIRPLSRPPIMRSRRTFGLAEQVTEDMVTQSLETNKTKGVQDASSESTKTNDMVWANKLYRELQNERECKLCVICQDKPKSILLLPCRHMCLCEVCLSAVITSTNSCPICRRSILDSLSVFLS